MYKLLLLLRRGLGLFLGGTLVALLAVRHHLQPVLLLRVGQLELGEPLLKVAERRHQVVDPVVVDDLGPLEGRTEDLGPVPRTRRVPGVAEDLRQRLFDLVEPLLGR